MVNLDITTISAIIGIITAVGVAIAFMVRLRMNVNHLEEKVNQLEKQIENHPLLASFRQYEQNVGVMDYFEYMLKTGKVEGK